VVFAHREDAARSAEAFADEARTEPEGESVSSVGDEEDDCHARSEHIVLFHCDPSTLLESLFVPANANIIKGL
jgi:hypothetical protein